MRSLNVPEHFQIESFDYKASGLRQLATIERAAEYLLDQGTTARVGIVDFGNDAYYVAVSSAPVPATSDDLFSGEPDDEQDPAELFEALENLTIEVPADFRSTVYTTDLMVPVMLEVAGAALFSNGSTEELKDAGAAALSATHAVRIGL